MLKPALSLLLLLVASLSMPVAAGQDIFSIYLLRHAEKQAASEAPGNPALTACGERRAQHIARLFAGVQLQRVYSSDYRRTRQTATPVARARGLVVDIYDPRALNEIAHTLLQRQQDAVVVGHSDTTSVLAGLLAGEQLAAFDERVYDRVYQVVQASGQSKIYLLHQGFDCPGDDPADD